MSLTARPPVERLQSPVATRNALTELLTPLCIDFARWRQRSGRSRRPLTLASVTIDRIGWSPVHLLETATQRAFLGVSLKTPYSTWSLPITRHHFPYTHALLTALDRIFEDWEIYWDARTVGRGLRVPSPGSVDDELLRFATYQGNITGPMRDGLHDIVAAWTLLSAWHVPGFVDPTALAKATTEAGLLEALALLLPLGAITTMARHGQIFTSPTLTVTERGLPAFDPALAAALATAKRRYRESIANEPGLWRAHGNAQAGAGCPVARALTSGQETGIRAIAETILHDLQVAYPLAVHQFAAERASRGHGLT